MEIGMKKIELMEAIMKLKKFLKRACFYPLTLLLLSLNPVLMAVDSNVLADTNGGLHFGVTNQISNKTEFQVEICDYVKGQLPTVCVQTPENRRVAYNRTRLFHISENDLKRMLAVTEERAIQFRFRDRVNRTSVFWGCKEHPFVVIDTASVGKRFHIDLIGSHLASYACRIFREEGPVLVREERNEPLIETVAHKLTEYKEWFKNEEGLTFSVENKMGDQKPRLRVRVCNYSQVWGPSNCILMNDVDFIHYNQTRIYHINKPILDQLLKHSDEPNKIQFSFEDTVSGSQKYRPCQEHPFTQLELLKAKKDSHGHRYAIVVDGTGAKNAYHCSIDEK